MAMTIADLLKDEEVLHGAELRQRHIKVASAIAGSLLGGTAGLAVSLSFPVVPYVVGTYKLTKEGAEVGMKGGYGLADLIIRR